MSFGQNLQFLWKMRNKMTQEELAEKMGVSRQTVSKWELDTVYPEMDKVVELCNIFSC
ncbi:MAG: helix-turn-helix domain-containing protein [Lachnospiraceae bacterium]|nr:helix-turn-helix domain-containing protein [Lachnospiraceae bacterium]